MSSYRVGAQAGTGRKRLWIAWLPILAAFAAAHSQTLAITPAGAGGPVEPSRIVSPEPSAQAIPTEGRIVRAIDDPGTGLRWLLTLSEDHPAGPGRLAAVAGPRNADRRSMSGAGPTGRSSPAGLSRRLVSPIIRARDKIVVEEHTAVVEAYLEAVALGPATAGMEFDARLKIGGALVRVVAFAPGRAALRPQTGVRR